MLSLRPDGPLPTEPTAVEERDGEEIRAWAKRETGYIQIQGTRPQTLAYGLTDSPAGLAAWIIEKFHGFTDHGGDFELAVALYYLLANISLYWFTGSRSVPHFGPIRGGPHGPWPIPEGVTVDVPTGYSAFPRESAVRQAHWRRRPTPASGNGRLWPQGGDLLYGTAKCTGT